MVTAQVESYTACLDELKAIFPAHWEELAVDKPNRPLNPKYDNYLQLDALGVVALATLRDGACLVGYIVGFVFPELHYDLNTCFTDIFYVGPEYRRGWNGSKLFSTFEAELRRRNVNEWAIAEKVHKPCAPLLRRKGFAHTENTYRKRLAA